MACVQRKRVPTDQKHASTLADVALTIHNLFPQNKDV